MIDVDENLLEQIADLHGVPQGAYNIRKNGELLSRNVTANIDIVSKKNADGIDIIVKPNTVNESVHIPVIITKTDIKDMVYNDFYIGENCDVVIVAGCGIHNSGDKISQHDGIHTFHIGKNSKVKYIEKHIGLGKNEAEKILNPTTDIELKENSVLTMVTVQIKGVSAAKRVTNAKLLTNSKLIINEVILTENEQIASTEFNVELNGKNSAVEVVSRSVAKHNSRQVFKSNVIGNNECFGHVECDALILDDAKVVAIPQIIANDSNATLVHEAAIGKIASEQKIKLMTLGLTEKEAEQLIIEGFLK